MDSSTISRVRLHDPSALGRSGLVAADEAGSHETCASPRRLLTNAPAWVEKSTRRPKTLSSRPETDDLMELSI